MVGSQSSGSIAPTEGPTSFALFPLRLALGAIFIYEGWSKATGLSGWIDVVALLGIPFPATTGTLVMIAELVGGIGIVLGVLTRFTSTILTIVMITAITVALTPAGFGAWAYEMALAGALTTLVVNGPGRPTLGTMLGRSWVDPEEPLWKSLRARIRADGADVDEPVSA